MASELYRLDNFVAYMESWGLKDVMLPFLLVFTVTYAIFTKAKILGEEKRNFNTVIALVLAGLVVVPHVTLGTLDTTDARLSNGLPDAVEMINNSLPSISVVIIAATLSKSVRLSAKSL